MDPELRPLVDGDLDEVALLHCAIFPESTFARLGPVAARAHYAAQLSAPGIVGLGAHAGERLAGFCIAGVLAGSERARLLRTHGARLALCAILHPRIAAAWWFARDRPSGPPARAGSFDIHAVAVHPALRRGGIGRLLMTRAEAIASARGHAEIGLAVHRRRDELLRFYETLGWTKITVGGVWYGRMTKKI